MISVSSFLRVLNLGLPCCQCLAEPTTTAFAWLSAQASSEMRPRRVGFEANVFDRLSPIAIDPSEGYKTLVEGTPVSIHPSSALFQRPPEWCIYYELVLTASKHVSSTTSGPLTCAEEYMHQITAIEPKWLSEVAPTFFRVADQNKISKRKASEKIEPLFDRFAADKDDWVGWLSMALPHILLTHFIATQQAEKGDAIFSDFRVNLTCIAFFSKPMQGTFSELCDSFRPVGPFACQSQVIKVKILPRVEGIWFVPSEWSDYLRLRQVHADSVPERVESDALERELMEVMKSKLLRGKLETFGCHASSKLAQFWQIFIARKYLQRQRWST